MGTNIVKSWSADSHSPVAEAAKEQNSTSTVSEYRAPSDAPASAIQYSPDMTRQQKAEWVATIDIHRADGDGTPLHLAARCNDATLIELLVKAGANIEAVSDEKVTPLLEAVCADSPDAAKALIHAGANVNAKHTKGTTPLHFAALGGKVAMVNVLLSAGADLSAVTHELESAADWAMNGGFESLAQLLQECGV